MRRCVSRSHFAKEFKLRDSLIGSLIVVLCSSCATSKSFVPYGEIHPPIDQDVKIIAQPDSVPSSCIRIGELHIYDAGLAIRCGYEDVLNQAKKESNAHGGNAFKITRVSAPNFWGSSCYRIRGEILLCKSDWEGN